MKNFITKTHAYTIVLLILTMTSFAKGYPVFKDNKYLCYHENNQKSEVRLGLGVGAQAIDVPRAEVAIGDIKHVRIFATSDDGETTFFNMPMQTAIQIGIFNGLGNLEGNNLHLGMTKEVQLAGGTGRFRGAYLSGSGGIGWKSIGGVETNNPTDGDMLLNSKAHVILGLAGNYSTDQYTVAIFLEHWSNGATTDVNIGHNILGVKMSFKLND